MPAQKPGEQGQSDTLDKLVEISNILDTGLDRDTIHTLKQLCDQGINPQALAQVVKFLRRTSDQENNGNQ